MHRACTQADAGSSASAGSSLTCFTQMLIGSCTPSRRRMCGLR